MPLPLLAPLTAPPPPPPLHCSCNVPPTSLPPANSHLPVHSLQVPFSPTSWLGALPCALPSRRVAVLPARSLSTPNARPPVSGQARAGVCLHGNIAQPTVRPASLCPGCRAPAFPGTGGSTCVRKHTTVALQTCGRDAPRSHHACLVGRKANSTTGDQERRHVRPETEHPEGRGQFRAEFSDGCGQGLHSVPLRTE